MNWIFSISILIVFEFIADVFAKEYSLHGTLIRWLGAFISYTLANIFWLFAIRNGSGLGRGAIIFSVASAVLAVVIGLLLYRESLTKIQLAGVLIGIVSLVLIFWHN